MDALLDGLVIFTMFGVGGVFAVWLAGRYFAPTERRLREVEDKMRQRGIL